MGLTQLGHSRLVKAAKVVLPLAALAILSTLFLLPRPVDPTRAIPQFGIDIEDLARDPRVTEASYAGVLDDGGALTVTAATLRTDQDRFTRLNVTDVMLALDTPDGARLAASARTGRIDQGTDLMTLRGDVRIDDATGYRLRTEHLTVALDRTWISATTPVRGAGPGGTLTAGGMELTRGGDGAHLLVFTSGVELIYRPD